MRQIPALCVIPHGGYRVPEELEDYVMASEAELFLSGDTAANEIFDAGKKITITLKSEYSPLFMDLDRPPNAVPPRYRDGVLKQMTPFGKELYEPGLFPDEIAIAAMLKRYYAPFHSQVHEYLVSSSVNMVVQCHTVLGYGPRGAADADRPRPLVKVRYKTEQAGRETIAAPRFLAGLLLEGLASKLKDEAEHFPGEAFVLDDQPVASHIMGEHNGRIPIVRLELSRALFLDEQWFDPRRLRVDPSRVRRLQDYFVHALDRACRKFF